MMLLYPLIALAVTAHLASANLGSAVPEFVGNVTVTGNPEEFAFRLTSTSLLSLLNFNSLYFSSLEISWLGLNAVYASFYTSGGLGLTATPPVAYVTEFASSLSWTGGANPVSADVSAAASMAMTAYVSVEGLDANESSLGKILLKDLDWSVSSLTRTGELSYALFEGTRAADDFCVSIDVVTSSVLGQLNWGAIATPRVVKTRVNISNYPDSSADKVVLSLLAASTTVDAEASVRAEVDGALQLVRGSTDAANQGVYFEFASEALCGGSACAAQIDVSAGSMDDLAGTPVWTQITASASAGLYQEVKQVSVTFDAAGSSEWLWDPTVGSGTPPNYVEPGMDTGLLIGLSVAGVVLVAAVCFFLYKRRQSNKAALSQQGTTYNTVGGTAHSNYV